MDNWNEIFSKHFRSVINNKPQKDEVIAVYSTTAELVDGIFKRDLIKLLVMPNKAVAALKVFQKLGFAKEPHTYKVLIQICEDLLSGMNLLEVEQKPYPFIMEQMYYVKPEFIPEDPKWSLITLHFLEKKEIIVE